MQEVRFDSIVPKETPVVLGDSKYVLRQASGLSLDQYKRKLAECTSVVDGRISVSDPGKAVEAGKLLVSLCLFDEKDVPVPIAVIQSWPGEVGDALVEAAMDLHPSLTGKKANLEADVKNS